MASDIAEIPDSLDSSPCLQGERVALTGTLASMTHSQAQDLIVEQGGEPVAHLSRQTTMLVVGEEGWPLDDQGHPSLKLQQAVELSAAGVPLQILNESAWLRLLGLEKRERGIHRLFTPAMLQQKLGVPAGVVRRWERLGLIKPVQRVFRLPYFDYQEVLAVRRLQELLERGVSHRQIEHSLQALRSLLPSVDQPLAQLEILERDSRLLFRDRAGLVEASSGQRVFDFDAGQTGGRSESSEDEATPVGLAADAGEVEVSQVSIPFAVPAQITGFKSTCSGSDSDASSQYGISDNSQWSADEWFDYGCRQLETGQTEVAIEAFRASIMLRHDDPEVHFFLASALFRAGNMQGALERYHVAVELDHEYIEAWTQLGCVRHLLGEYHNALDAFDIALTVHPDYADAIYHKAEVLDELQRTDEAIELWHRCLSFDHDGPWADDIRMRLDALPAATPGDQPPT